MRNIWRPSGSLLVFNSKECNLRNSLQIFICTSISSLQKLKFLTYNKQQIFLTKIVPCFKKSDNNALLILFFPSYFIKCKIHIWCDFDRASSLICGNKMPIRCNRGFYCRSYCLLNMFRASLCPSSGAQEYYTVVAACCILCCGFSSSWSGVELRVMCPVCRMLHRR